MMLKARVALLGGISLLVAAQAQAQSTGKAVPATVSASETGIQDIIVTARRRSESLLETPVAVTAFTADELDRRQISQISDIQKSTPSLIYEGTGGNSSEARVFIRGVGNTFANISYGAGVGIYIDGAFFPRAQGALLDNLDIASIEVLRGPQGTLFGKNTIGGAINITTARPNTDAFSGTLEAGYGRFDRVRVRGSVNIPLGDNLAIRLAGLRDRDDGYTTNDFDGRRLDNHDRWVASGSLRFTPTENLTFDLSGFYSRDRTDGRGFQCFSTGGSAFGNVVFGAACDRTNANGIRHTRSNVRQFGATDMFATSSTLAWDMGQVGFIDELTFKAIGAYQNIDGSGRTQDYDGTDLDGAYAIEIEKKMAQASGELQILGEAFDKRLNFVMGAYIDREWTPGGADTRFTSVFPTLEPGRLLSTLGILSLKNKSRALYSQFTYDFNEVVSLTAGIRYTKDTKGFRAQKFSVSSLDPAHTRVGPFLTNGVFIKDFTNTSPMATLQLNAPAAWTGGFLDKGMIYFTFSKGFKSGGFNGNGEVVRGTFTSFNPEKVDNYETGIKFSMFDRHLTGSLTGYKMDYRDIQLQVTGINPDTGGFINTTFNAGAAEVKGIELEMQALLTSSLRFGLNADVSDSRYTRFDDASVPGGSRVGEPLAFIPDYRISGSLENRFSLGEDMALTPRVQVTRTGDRYLYTDKSAIVRAASLQRAVTLVDASLRFDLNENVSFDVYGKNIFNKKYKDDVQSVGFVVMSYYAPPVTYGVNARLKF